MGIGVISFARSLARDRPDVLLLLGDRFEMHAAATSALPLRIPVAHLHGGELTQGAFDDALRHSITKLSHLHFASTEAAGRRIVQLGEEPWRVTISGAPSLDGLREVPTAREASDLVKSLGLPEGDFLLVTYHPETLGTDPVADAARAVLDAIAEAELPAVLTAANNDPGGRGINRLFAEFAAGREKTAFVPTLGAQRYRAAMARAVAMVGNSSSGIVEAGSLGLPVVNVGERQRGRERGLNVVDAPTSRAEIAAAIRRVTHPAFRRSLDGMQNPYDRGGAAPIILGKLRTVDLGASLLTKRFFDLPEVR
jgi:UDP-hydrolysing UDP-N-acetyl-D-glucosamine 2-epimerase